MKHLVGTRSATLRGEGIVLNGQVELTADIAGPLDPEHTAVSGKFFTGRLPTINGVIGCRLDVGGMRPVGVEVRLPVNSVPGLAGTLDLSFPPGATDETWLNQFFG
jgi:hypothetical protein